MPCESGNGEQFWLLFCDKPIDIVAETFNDPYKNTYYKEDCVICGCYYDLLRSGSRTYYFHDDAEPTYIYSHLVCASKSTMPPISYNIHWSYATFELLVETFRLIKGAFENMRLINDDM